MERVDVELVPRELEPEELRLDGVSVEVPGVDELNVVDGLSVEEVLVV
jgi:hypothetical protein